MTSVTAPSNHPKPIITQQRNMTSKTKVQIWNHRFEILLREFFSQFWDNSMSHPNSTQGFLSKNVHPWDFNNSHLRGVFEAAEFRNSVF